MFTLTPGLPSNRRHAVSATVVTVAAVSRYLEEPAMIAAFNGKQAGKQVVQVACGSTYSAAITADGELFTWGRGNYGRLGHGEHRRTPSPPSSLGHVTIWPKIASYYVDFVECDVCDDLNILR